MVKVRCISVACASGLAIAFSTSAVAQDTANATSAREEATSGVGDIIVTAQKRAENLQRIPIAITAVSPMVLRNAGIDSVQDLPAVLPGVQIVNISNSLVPRVRGIGSGFTAAGLESPIATFIDDVYHAFAADIELDFADVSQVAVVKGPQGTLFGRNATGGVLQITTRPPSQDFGGSMQTSFDNYLTSRSNIFVTGGLTEGLAASLSVSYTHQGKGYGTNIATRNDQYKIDSAFGARGKLRATLGERTTVDLIGDYSARRGATAANYRTPDGYSTILPSPQPVGAWNSSRAIDSYQNFKGGGISLKASHEFDFATLTSISGYRDAKIDYRFTPVTSANRARNIFVAFSSKQFTQEIQLVSPATGPFTWTIGGFYYYNDAGIGFDNDLFGPLGAVFSRQSFPGQQTTRSIAGFAQGTFKLTETTRLTGGIRYTRDTRRFTSQFIATSAITGVTSTLARVDDRPYNFEKPTWRVALDQDLGPNALAYVSYNRGIKSGGFNTTSTTNPPYEPEQLDAYEAGIKSQFLDNRVRLNVSAFYYDYKNIQINIFTNGAPLVLNAAAAENYGIDADLTAKITEGLTLTASANWLHARFKSFPNAPIGVPNPNFQGSTFVAGSAAGNALPFSPNFTYSLGLSYEVPTSFGKITLNANDNYNSGFFGEPDNRLRQKSYHFLNASVALASLDDRFEVRGFINNILNEAVQSQMVTAPWGYEADYSNPPLTVGASIKLGF
jgi:iron complex outermembrane recepter protein